MNQLRRGAVLCVVAALLSACTGGPARERPRAGDPEPERQGDRTVTVRGARDEATLDLVSGVDALSVTVSDLGDDLAVVRTPAAAPIAPVVETDGPIRVTVSAADAPGSANMAITLSSATRWTLRFAGGGKVHTVDLRGGRVAGVDFVAGVASIDLTLPEPDGVVVVRMAGGATTFDVHAPPDVPVRVRMTGGGGSAVIDGATRSGIPGGTVVEPTGWAGAADRYDIDAVAGVSSLSLDRRA
jgi:hypothetical protein